MNRPQIQYSGARRFIFLIALLLIAAAGWTQTPPAPDPEFVKAQALESQGKLDEAVKIYETLFQAGPNDLYFWKLMVVYERLGNFTGMERVALSRLRERPGDIAVVSYLSRAYHGQGDKEKARRVLMESIGDRWSDQARVRNAASEFQFRQDLEGAVGIFLMARSKLNDPNAYALDLARLYSAQMNFSAATGEYLKAMGNSPAAFPSIEMLIKQHAGAHIPLPDLARPLEQYLRANPKSVPAAKLLAQVRQRLGDGQGAFRAVLGAAAGAGTPQDAWGFAEQLAAEGNREDALFAYSEFHRVFPSDPNARTALLKAAGLRMEGGDHSGAKRDYAALAGEYPGTAEAQFAALRLIQLSEGDGVDLTERLRAFVDSTLDRAVAYEARILLADHLLRQGDTGLAGQTLSQAVLMAQSRKERYDALTRSALLHFFTGDYETMARDIEFCVSGAPDGEDSNDLLTLRVLALRSATEQDRRNLGTYARGRFAFYRGLEAEGVDSLAVAAADTATVAASAAASALGDHWREKGDAARAVDWYDRAVIAARDTTIRVQAMMDAAEVERGELRNPDAARKRYVEALTVYPGTVFEAELRKRLRSIVEK